MQRAIWRLICQASGFVKRLRRPTRVRFVGGSAPRGWLSRCRGSAPPGARRRGRACRASRRAGEGLDDLVCAAIDGSRRSLAWPTSTEAPLSTSSGWPQFRRGVTRAATSKLRLAIQPALPRSGSPGRRRCARRSGGVDHLPACVVLTPAVPATVMVSERAGAIAVTGGQAEGRGGPTFIRRCRPPPPRRSRSRRSSSTCPVLR